MKKTWIKWVIIGLLAVIIFVVVVPIIINESYKANSGYMTIWGAADVLTYYGTILGALVAIATIVITISFTKKQIQRESYLKNETEKWSKIDGLFSVALDAINPIRPLLETIDTGLTNPTAAITIFQKYQMSCQTATDQLIAFLNCEDYPQVKVLLDHVNNSAKDFCEICEKEIKAYAILRDFSSRKTAEDTLKMENEYPNAFREDTLSFCQELLDKTKGITMNVIDKDIAASNEKMVSAYETTYKKLLLLKVQVFEAIYAKIRQKADCILRFEGNASV